jgi:hypothetical protein
MIYNKHGKEKSRWKKNTIHGDYNIGFLLVIEETNDDSPLILCFLVMNIFH